MSSEGGGAGAGAGSGSGIEEGSSKDLMMKSITSASDLPTNSGKSSDARPYLPRSKVSPLSIVGMVISPVGISDIYSAFLLKGFTDDIPTSSDIFSNAGLGKVRKG